MVPGGSEAGQDDGAEENAIGRRQGAAAHRLADDAGQADAAGQYEGEIAQYIPDMRDAEQAALVGKVVVAGWL